MPVQECLVDNRGQHDARHDINEHRRRRHGDAEECGYSAHRDGRYDSDEDQMALEPPGPRVFSRVIHSMPLPSPFRPPTSIAKYNGKTKPKLWLADFRLACQLGGARGDDQATSGWHASWEVLEGMIKPSSDSCRSSSPTPLEGGSMSFLPTKSTTGLTWSGYSRGNSRGPTSALATHGTSASASRNQENLSESMLITSRPSVPSSRTSPTTMSFWPLSQAPHARIWCEN